MTFQNMPASAAPVNAGAPPTNEEAPDAGNGEGSGNQEIEQKYNTTGGAEEQGFPPLRVRTFGELLTLVIPPRNQILSPWLTEKSLSLIHAARGVGKTYLVIGIALAVASGGKFLKWHALGPRRVIVFDGEMPLRTLQERFRDAAANFPSVPDGNLLLVAADDQEDRPMPDVSTPEGQQEVDALLRSGDLLILDNISTLCRTGVENEAEGWSPIQGWLLNLRRSGVSVVLIGHDGKNGTQRGTSKREDVLDTVIQLRRPQGYRSEQGARFEVVYRKARGLCGKDVETFEAQLETVNGAPQWSIVEGELATTKRIAELTDEGFSQREIAREVGFSKSTVGRHQEAARAMGLIK